MKSATGKTELERFSEKYEVDESGCWLWTAYVLPNGYARFKPTGQPVGYAHRWSYEHFVGPIGSGLFIDHVRARGCLNKHCVNPDHLEAVPNRENLLRAPWTLPARMAARTHCNYGHKYTPENTVYRTYGGKRYRKCRTCLQREDKARYARWKAKQPPRIFVRFVDELPPE